MRPLLVNHKDYLYLSWPEYESTFSPILSYYFCSAVTDTFICHVFYHSSMVESVKLVVLIAFCSQGDNVLDATSLVSYLDEWLKLKLQSGKVCFFKIYMWQSWVETEHYSVAYFAQIASFEAL